MKRIFIITFFFIPGILFGQARNSGRMVVPIGWETQDSLRFYLQTEDDARNNNLTGSDSSKNALLLRILDSVSNTFAGCSSDPSFPLGRMKGVVAGYEDPVTGNAFFYNTSVFFNQWEFSALPHPKQPRDLEHPYWNRGFLWRYNDANSINTAAHSDTNYYDANDISPYSEYLIFRNNEFMSIDPKNFSNLFKIIERDGTFGSFDTTNKILSKMSFPSKLFLCEFKFSSIHSKVVGKNISNIHNSKIRHIAYKPCGL
jgi:hypothetical protein